MHDYETFSTTADVGIRIRGNGYEGLFRNAVKGLNLLWFHDVPGLPSGTDKRSVHHFEFHGDGPENILVNFLSEVVYVLQNLEAVTVDVQFKRIDETSVDADLITVPLERTPGLEIKSVTYHNLSITDIAGAKSTEIIFDI